MSIINMKKSISKIASIMFVFLLCCCVKSNEQKTEFIQNNIQKTTNKIAEKYGNIIIPDFLMEEATTMKKNIK